MLAKRNRTAAIAPLFSVKKKHSWKNKLIALLLRFFIFLVIFGTIIWFLLNAHFNLPHVFPSFLNKLTPQVASSSAQVKQTSIDKVRKLIDRAALFQVSSATQTDNYLVIVSKDNMEVYFSLDKDLAGQVTTLQTLITKAKIDNKTLKKVDFRFDKIVVQY